MSCVTSRTNNGPVREAAQVLHDVTYDDVILRKFGKTV